MNWIEVVQVTLPSSFSSAVLSENVKLADLLSKPSNPSLGTVPPPVPTYWHQEPKESLPKDEMRKFLPPHPADRAKAALAAAAAAASAAASAVTTASSSSTTPKPPTSSSVATGPPAGAVLLLQTASTSKPVPAPHQSPPTLHDTGNNSYLTKPNRTVCS